MRLLKTLILIVSSSFLLIACGTGGGGGGGGDDGGGGPTVTGNHSASGTYSYDNVTSKLNVNFTSSDFIDCGPDVGLDMWIVTYITATNMEWIDPGDNSTRTFTRTSNEPGGIVGTWEITDPDGNNYVVKFDSNGNCTVDANIVKCD